LGFERSRGFPSFRYLDTEIENLREGLRLSYLAPRHNVEVVIGQMDAMLAAPLGESPFVQMAKPGSTHHFRQDLEALEKGRIRPCRQNGHQPIYAIIRI
jgi:uncharacterized protein (DUF885 family)